MPYGDPPGPGSRAARARRRVGPGLTLSDPGVAPIFTEIYVTVTVALAACQWARNELLSARASSPNPSRSGHHRRLTQSRYQ